MRYRSFCSLDFLLTRVKQALLNWCGSICRLPSSGFLHYAIPMQLSKMYARFHPCATNQLEREASYPACTRNLLLRHSAMPQTSGTQCPLLLGDREVLRARETLRVDKISQKILMKMYIMIIVFG